MIKWLIILITLYLFLYCFVFKQDYINASQIIKKQLLSIIKQKSKRRKSDIYSFVNIYIIPLFLAFFVAIVNIFKVDFYDNIVLILAILVSVFLTFISVLTSKSYKTKSENQKKIIMLTFTNVYFLTVISVLLLILCFIKISLVNFSFDFEILKDIPILANIININNIKISFNTVVTYLIIEIIIHLLIVLKRIEQIFFITIDD